jgi:phosphoglycerate dehydrogenase-like enzyme
VPGTEKLADALPQADFIVLACALTPETRGLIGAQALAGLDGRLERASVVNPEVFGP